MAELEPGPLDVDVEHITVRGVDGVAVPAVHARPDGMPVAGIVVHPDIMGVRPLFDDLCRRLATHGFAVCCPEPFARAPVEVRGANDDPAARMAYAHELDDELQIGDLVEVEGVGDARARAIKEGLSRLAETSILERYV